MPNVESSVIERIDYNPERRLLSVTFTNGHRYLYFDVPQSVYRHLLEAESRGRYFNLHIRDRYDFRKLS